MPRPWPAAAALNHLNCGADRVTTLTSRRPTSTPDALCVIRCSPAAQLCGTNRTVRGATCLRDVRMTEDTLYLQIIPFRAEPLLVTQASVVIHARPRLTWCLTTRVRFRLW